MEQFLCDGLIADYDIIIDDEDDEEEPVEVYLTMTVAQMGWQSLLPKANH